MPKSSNLYDPTSATTASAPEQPRTARTTQSRRVLWNVFRPSDTSAVASNVIAVWVRPRTNTTVDRASPQYAVRYRTSTPSVPKHSAASTINDNPMISCRTFERSVFSKGRRSCFVSIVTYPDVVMGCSFCLQDSSPLVQYCTTWYRTVRFLGVSQTLCIQ